MGEYLAEINAVETATNGYLTKVVHKHYYPHVLYKTVKVTEHMEVIQREHCAPSDPHPS